MTVADVRRRITTLPGGPALWLGLAALVVAVIALVIAVNQTSTPATTSGVTGPVGPTIPVASAPLSLAPAVVATATPSQKGQCPAATVSVSTADQLTTALADAKAGDVIQLADGTYTGQFTAATKGTADQPIYLCGSAAAVIDGGGIKKGYAVHLDGADYWRLTGFTVRDSQKGVMADRTNHAVINGLTVEQIGDEAIHLRAFSSDNVVENNTVHDTGQRKEKFGEGIYIGTATSNWSTVTGGQPDTSDRNLVRGNTVTATTAEAIDIKEGTTGGTVSGNTFDGSALTGADSWVDVKGNDWTITGNTGTHSPQDGFQTHSVVDGWGTGNTFAANTATVDGPGYGYHLAPVLTNRVECSNKATGAAQGLANVDCR